MCAGPARRLWGSARRAQAPPRLARLPAPWLLPPLAWGQACRMSSAATPLISVGNASHRPFQTPLAGPAAPLRSPLNLGTLVTVAGSPRPPPVQTPPPCCACCPGLHPAPKPPTGPARHLPPPNHSRAFPWKPPSSGTAWELIPPPSKASPAWRPLSLPLCALGLRAGAAMAQASFFPLSMCPKPVFPPGVLPLLPVEACGPARCPHGSLQWSPDAVMAQDPLLGPQTAQ